MKTKIYSLLFLLLLLSSCTKDNNPVAPSNDSGKVTLGETINLLTQSIGSFGGIIKIEKPGDKLNGMEIIIPPNAFTQTKTFKISYAEIKEHQLGQYFNPISPMIKVSYEGGYSDGPIEVKIPIKLPKDDFAMGFFYDEKTGSLEGLPIESLDSNLITISTRTFASSSSLGKSNRRDDISSSLFMVISSLSESILKSQTVIASGFAPGYDDWEFINKGSYIAPKGHCAGQSMTAMWYYYEKNLKGESNLFHRFDEVNDKLKPGLLWQDNPLGYKFASVIQKDFNFDNWIESLTWKANYPGLVFKAFAVSILLTGEPQFVLIRNSALKVGHAMIVYKVNYNEGKLYIADPNYPNNRVGDGTESVRTINYVNNILEPYETGLIAGEHSTAMDQIGYFGKTSYINWDQIGQRWIEFENKTIGNTSFPPYQLKIKNDGDKDLIDQQITDKDTLKIYCRCPLADGILGTDHYMLIEVYDEKGNQISRLADEFKGIPEIALLNGINKIGVYIEGSINNKWRYLDFKWLRITRHSLIIEPDPLIGIWNSEYTFTARAFGTAPNPYKMVWNFGDASPEVTVENDSTVKHIYKTQNTFEVKVSLYNKDNNKLAEAKSTAIISSGDMWVNSITSSGYIGDTVVIRGFGFGESQGLSKVIFQPEKTASITSWSNTLITATVPDEAITGYVKVIVGVKSDSVNFKVSGKILDIIKPFKKVGFELVARMLLDDSTENVHGINFTNLVDTVKPDIIWSGNTFSYERSTNELTRKVTGTVSDDGRIILYFKCEYVFDIPVPVLEPPEKIRILYMEVKEFTVKNVPYKYVTSNGVSYYLQTNTLNEYVSEVHWDRYFITLDGPEVIKINSIDWSYLNSVNIGFY